MDFGDFFEAFGNGYRALQDKTTGKALGKEWFCRDLLCAIAKHEEYVTHVNGIVDKQHARTERAFYAYYRNGKQRRSLHPIAMFIVNSLDTDKFKKFLETYVKNYSEEQLLRAFQKYLPQTSAETLFDDITDLFCGIITTAANVPDKRKGSSKEEPSELQNPLDSNAPEAPTSLRDRVEFLLRQLESGAIKLYTDYLNISAKYDAATPKQRKEFDETICKDHSEFTNLNDTLQDYIVKYPSFRELVNLFTTGDCWVLSFFRPWDQSCTLPMPEGMMDYYQQLMKAAKEALPAYFEHNAL